MNFLNSNFFVAFITLIVGLVAFIIYEKQKKDLKKDIANIILLEITSAERSIKKISDHLLKNTQTKDTLPQDVFTMPNESWNENKFLFLNDFNRDEWDTINNFYHNCTLLDDAIKRNNSAFWNDVESIRENKQRIVANYATKATDKFFNNKKLEKKIEKELVDKSEKFDSFYMKRQARWHYNPIKPITDAKRYVDDLSKNLSQTSVGIKLNSIAKI